MLPGQKWLLERRGYEAAILTGAGSLCGVIVLVLLSPFLTEVARTLRIILAPHFGWILAAISLFMLMSEWPKAGDRGPSNWARFRAAWSQLAAGLLTFFLSGLLGIILMYRNFLPVIGGLCEFAAGLHRLVCDSDGADEFDHGHARAAAAHQHLDRSVNLRCCCAAPLPDRWADCSPRSFRW